MCSNMNIALKQSKAIEDFFEHPQEGTILTRILKEKIRLDPSSHVDTYEQGVKKARNTKFVFVEHDQTVIIKTSCDIYVTPYIVKSNMLGFAWAKNLPHGEFFEYFVNRLFDTGIMNKISRKYLIKPKADCTETRQFVSMGFTNIVSAFVLLVLASCSAVVIGLVECMVKRC